MAPVSPGGASRWRRATPPLTSLDDAWCCRFQTVAELRYGALHASWGDRRRRDLEDRLSRAAVIGVDDALATAYAELREECIRSGHALGAKEHPVDRWIAVIAIHHGLPLVSDDGDFVGCPRLTLIREPTVAGELTVIQEMKRGPRSA